MNFKPGTDENISSAERIPRREDFPKGDSLRVGWDLFARIEAHKNRGGGSSIRYKSAT